MTDLTGYLWCDPHTRTWLWFCTRYCAAHYGAGQVADLRSGLDAEQVRNQFIQPDWVPPLPRRIVVPCTLCGALPGWAEALLAPEPEPEPGTPSPDAYIPRAA